jgi:hypothetical protein
MSQYVELEEELEIENIRSMENIITDVIKKENFTDFHDKHEITTTYLKWKKSNIDPQNKN